MDRVKIITLSLLLSLLYFYLSIYLTGIGAAIAIPESIIKPLIETAPTLAFASIDLITIGIPLIALYVAFAMVIRHFNHARSTVPYIILLLPFLSYSFFELVSLSYSNDLVHHLVTMLPKYMLVLMCSVTFIKLTKSTQHSG